MTISAMDFLIDFWYYNYKFIFIKVFFKRRKRYEALGLGRTEKED
jgi:hypothetical protein